MKIGLIGGTFDPIHNGHLIIAQEAFWQLGLAKVYFIPAGDPPHKQSQDITAAQHRVAMIHLAIESQSHFDVSEIEIERAGLSYTADTLAELSRQFAPQDELFFIIGADAAAELLSWYHPERVLALTRLVVAERPGYQFPLEKLQAGLPQLDLTRRVIILDVPMMEISSHELRDRIAVGAPIRYLLPSRVADYIQKNQLYQPGLSQRLASQPNRQNNAQPHLETPGETALKPGEIADAG